jgi:pheromone shutdown protein TraB
MIHLLGTGHVFDLRERLQREILARAPDVVALELDPARLQALVARHRGTAGEAPLTYKLLAQFQDRLAAERGIAPGDEMLAAYEAAQLARIPVELIDLDAQVAFQRLWQHMGLVEKARFFGSTVLTAILPSRYVEKELEELQGDYAAMLEALGKDYPTVKRVLLDERNEHMAQRIAALRAGGKQSIVVVIGDGHVEGIAKLLAAKGLGAEVATLRLKELQAEAPKAEGTATAGFSVKSG